jgi:hypothetical protein
LLLLTRYWPKINELFSLVQFEILEHDIGRFIFPGLIFAEIGKNSAKFKECTRQSGGTATLLLCQQYVRGM